ncbi:MAG: lysophospholipid acyltransferase family protein [Gemmataceae bacterium]
MYSADAQRFYNLTFLVAYPVMTLGFSLRTAGSRRMPASGPVLLIANHESYFDPLLVGLAVRRQISYLARKSLFRNPAFAWLIRRLGAVPIDLEGSSREGLQISTDILKQQNPLLIFPEGERSRHGHLQPFKPGMMLILKKCPVPVLPIGIAGAYESFPLTKKLPRLSPLFWPSNGGELAVSIGRLIPPSAYQALERDAALEFFRQEVAQQIHQAEKLLKRL